MTAFYNRTTLGRRLASTEVDAMFTALAVGSFQRTFSAPANGDVTVVLKATHGGSITETDTQTDSGTCTVTWKVDGVASATTNAASTTLQAQTQSMAFVAGSKIVATISAAASPVNLAISMKFVRTIE